MSADTGELAAPTPRRKPLRTLRQIRAELASIYWQMKHAEIDSQLGARLVFTLSTLGRIIESSELESKIEALELEASK